MRILTRLIAILAVIVAIGGLVWVLMQEGAPVEDATNDLPQLTTKPTERRDIDIELPMGGVYAGIVVDEQGAPIEGARVILVAFNAGDDALMRAGAGGREFDPGDPSSIPTIGDYYIGGRELTTGPDGRWRIPAQSRARVTHALAYHQRYFLNVERVGRPQDDVRIVLKPAGRVKGQVVDHESGRAVPNVRVDIFLQHPTAPPPEMGEDGAYGARSGRGVVVERSEIALLGHFLAKELGERIWGIPYQGTEALRFRTDADGRFELGPLGEGVQLEFIVTHPDYKWFDFDAEGGKRTPRRTIVRGGETVEREFRLRKGKRISGRVIDAESGDPIEGVVMAFESITAYYRHWWDAQGQKRYVTTDKKGAFSMGGLALGRHNIVLTHPSFGKEYHHGAQAGTKNLEIHIKPRGRIQGTVEGLDKRPRGGRIFIYLEPVGEQTSGMTRLVRKGHVIDRKNRFGIEDVREGTYEIWIQAGSNASMPQTIEVKKGTPVDLQFPMGGGGSLELRLFDQNERAVDPAVVLLLRAGEKGERVIGRYVSRSGLLETDNVVPGKYRLKVEAPGFIPLTTDEIDVLEGRPTDVGRVTLARWGYMRMQSILTERGRAPDTKVQVEYREGDGAWRPLYSLAAHDVPVRPGSVSVRAKTETGLSFEQTYDAVGGETFVVDVVLSGD
ncbi:MAG: carboxypeptidase-like regulatory domain-containing protein [Planctomycetota bacterium]|nr:carboxypeptidase-like regulatory domain-containing protein [Planctomycetota bacterium]